MCLLFSSTARRRALPGRRGAFEGVEGFAVLRKSMDRTLGERALTIDKSDSSILGWMGERASSSEPLRMSARVLGPGRHERRIDRA